MVSSIEVLYVNRYRIGKILQIRARSCPKTRLTCVRLLLTRLRFGGSMVSIVAFLGGFRDLECIPWFRFRNSFRIQSSYNHARVFM